MFIQKMLFSQMNVNDDDHTVQEEESSVRPAPNWNRIRASNKLTDRNILFISGCVLSDGRKRYTVCVIRREITEMHTHASVVKLIMLACTVFVV